MITATERASRPAFSDFYRHHYLPEHADPRNVGLHVFGTVLSAAFVPAVLLTTSPFVLLLYPVVHALPGLIGHRLFERNTAVGDVRVLRKDFPLPWFIAANHLLSFDVGRRLLRDVLRPG